MAKRMRASLYSVHPSVAYARTILGNLKGKTGRSLEEWVALVEAEGPRDESGRRTWLTKVHGLGGSTAWMVAEWSVGKGREGVDGEAYLAAAPGYVETMYAGGKAALRPLHEALIERARALGPDVRICPCETIVPLYRTHVFAEIRPTTRTRIDLGLALRHVSDPLTGRLLPTGGLEKKDRITHRIPVQSEADLDAELETWLRTAYELDAPGPPSRPRDRLS